MNLSTRKTMTIRFRKHESEEQNWYGIKNLAVGVKFAEMKSTPSPNIDYMDTTNFVCVSWEKLVPFTAVPKDGSDGDKVKI